MKDWQKYFIGGLVGASLTTPTLQEKKKIQKDAFNEPCKALFHLFEKTFGITESVVRLMVIKAIVDKASPQAIRQELYDNLGYSLSLEDVIQITAYACGWADGAMKTLDFIK